MLAAEAFGRMPLRRPTWPLPGARQLLASVVGAALLLIAVAGTALAADPSATPVLTAGPTPTPAATPVPTATPAPTATPVPTSTPAATPTPDPTATPAPDPTPAPTPPPPPNPTPPAVSPPSLDLYVTSGFRYQDPNYVACTSASAMNMLNFIVAAGSGGPDFRWTRALSGSTRDSMLRWERTHDTLPFGAGSDPHGWRNALNYYGWGGTALTAPGRVYDDVAFGTYAEAMNAAVRALIATRKPVGILGWQGHHSQVITGYYGLVGDPFATDASGAYTDAFTIGGLYFSDALSSDRMHHVRVSYYWLQHTLNYRLRFRQFMQRDSTRDDPYTVGWQRSRDEWYRRFVVLLPLR